MKLSAVAMSLANGHVKVARKFCEISMDVLNKIVHSSDDEPNFPSRSVARHATFAASRLRIATKFP